MREAVAGELKKFRCNRSAQIEAFAHDSVDRFERDDNLRTYVFVAPAVEGAAMRILGLFAVGMTVLDYFAVVTKSKKKRLMGEVSVEVAGAYSIAELARSDEVSPEELPGKAILDEAVTAIAQAHASVGGRWIAVDCREEVFRALYEPAGFRIFNAKASSPSGMRDVDFLTACCVTKTLLASG